MKIVIKNTPDQQELLLKVIKGDKDAKDAMEKFMSPVYEQIINNQKLNQIDCDWLCVEELSLDVNVNFKVTILNKKMIRENKEKRKNNNQQSVLNMNKINILEKLSSETMAFHPTGDLSLGFMRYEALRKLNSHQFAELHSKNLKGKNFDDIVDEMIVESYEQ